MGGAGGDYAIQRQIRVVVGEDTNNGMGVDGCDSAVAGCDTSASLSTRNAILRHVKSYRLLMHIIDLRKAGGLTCKRTIDLKPLIMKSAIITLTICIFMGQGLFAQKNKDPNLNAPVPITQKATYDDWCIVEPIPFDDPECWATSASQCVALGLSPNVNLTEDANTGTYALVLMTGEDSIGMPFPAIAFFRNKINTRPDKITGYYKADFKGEDYASIRVTLTDERGSIGWGVLDITRSTTIYEHFEVPLHYYSPSVQPDSISFYIYSSYDLPTSGTILTLDDLALETLTDVAIPLSEKFTTRINPNPATDEIHVEVPPGLGLVNLRIYNYGGQIVANQDFEDQVRIDVSKLTAGLYFFEVRLPKNEIYDKGRFRVADHRQ